MTTTDVTNDPDRLIDDKSAALLKGCSRAQWWLGVSDGRYPPPAQRDGRMTRWRLGDVRRLITEGPKPANAEIMERRRQRRAQARGD